MLRRSISIMASLAFVATNASGQAFPSRPVRIVVPFPAGGTSDVIARSVTHELERQLGQSFIIYNRGGANSIIGSEIVAKAAPDGYTLLHVTAAFAINPSVYRKLVQEEVKRYAEIVRATKIEPQ